MTDKATLEAVARAICLTGPMDPDEIGANDGPNWKRYIDQAQAAIDAMPGWRDIESAPTTKNEFTISERILVVVPPYGASTAHYDDGWHCHSVLNKEAEPTHWMPLPEPPEKIK